MKKGLSILLVAAALFGFYGGAANLNDVLACKDYWEKAGEESTANMNKLEDGLNQLKENEQAYLDGQDQVADGEVALADAEKQLADGEVQLAEGRAELAKGEADYAAAPGKLADARKQIAKGEKDLAAGEKQLADGYKEYNAGKDKLAAGKKAVTEGEKALAAAEDQLAQGEKELAAGKQQVADGEKELEAGQASLDGLTQLIEGISTIQDGYNEWKPGYEALKQGRSDLFKGSSPAKDSLTALAAFLPEAAQGAYANAVNDVAGDDEKQTADDYKEFIKSTNTMVPALEAISSALAEKTAAANALKNALTASKADALTFAGIVDAKKDDIKELAKLIAVAKGEAAAKQFVAGVDKLSATFQDISKTIESNVKATVPSEVKKAVTAKTTEYMNSADGQNAVKALMEQGLSKEAAAEKVQNAYVEKATPEITEQVTKAVTEEVTKQAKAQANSNKELTGGEETLLGAVTEVAATLDGYNEQVNGDSSAIKTQLLPGLKKFNEATKNDKDNVNPVDKLTSGQDQLAGGVSQICSAVLGNEQLKAGVESNLGKDAIKLLTAYQNSTNPLSSKLSDFSRFEAQMETNPDVVTNLTKAKALLTATKAQGEKDLAAGKEALEAGKKKVAEGEAALAAGYAEYEKGKQELAAGKKQVAEGEPKLTAAEKQLAAGEKELAAGRKKLAAGKAEYAQGLKDYKAAPAKLADGRRQLAEGEATLQDGYQEYAKGKQDLADGKAKLAEYEDGEQQVRDGLKTLTDTEADLDLQSIADRLKGDVDFDNGDTHLDLEEGLAAVEVGRGYQAEDGVLITDEITARAVGTGALLGAGVLAVLAAILSFLKKNKGAGIFAVLAAAAGAFGAFYGTQAGTYFSNIAGSTVGATGWVAAGILGVVALVHAIAHFTAKKEA